MGERPYRAAIIGTGRIASLLERDPLRWKPHTHAAHYRALPATELVAGCDLDEERLAAFGDDWQIASDHLYRDYRAMLARERPDIVSICAYAPDRLTMCRAAIEAGARGLWIEKAVACSIEEAREIDRLVRAAGAAAIVDHPRRADTRYRTAARCIREGTLGRLETVHAMFSGNLIHTGSHAWDVLLDWCGPWNCIQAALDTVEDDRLRPGDDRMLEPPVALTAPAGAVYDRGGRARIAFAGGGEAFVTAGAKSYFIFQFDLIFSRGRIRLGNDVWEINVPAASPRYSGFVELAPVNPGDFVQQEDEYPTPMLADLVIAMEAGREPLQSVASAVAALELGVGVVQAGLTHAQIEPRSLDASLRVISV